MGGFFGNGIISQDSRRFRRLKSFCLIKYSLLNDPVQKKFLTNARDISAGGALFISEKSLPKGSMLEMDIYLPPLRDFFTVIANTVASSKVKYTDRYLVRTRFTASDPAERKRINDYIENLASNPLMQRYLDKKASAFKRQLL